jgi:hypothetical protein
MFLRAGLPFFDGRRQLVVRPILVFAARRRIDDASDVPRSREDETRRSLEQLGGLVDRNEGRDVVFLGRLQIDGYRHLGQIERQVAGSKAFDARQRHERVRQVQWIERSIAFFHLAFDEFRQ